MNGEVQRMFRGAIGGAALGGGIGGAVFGAMGAILVGLEPVSAVAIAQDGLPRGDAPPWSRYGAQGRARKGFFRALSRRKRCAGTIYARMVHGRAHDP